MSREQISAWWMLAPALAFTVTLALYPVLASFVLSLYRIFLSLPALGEPFVGLENYVTLLNDPAARQAFLVTAGFVTLSTALELALGLGIALVIHARFPGRGWVRAAALIPWVIPTAVSSQMWRYIFNDQYGLANLLLFGDRVAEYVPWFASPEIAFLIMVLADVWKTSSFAALLILAGLQLIPDDLYEAAVDVVVREGRGSVSLLQRALGIGYGRAARLIDYMAEDGVVGGYNGSNAREVLFSPEQWDELRRAGSH